MHKNQPNLISCVYCKDSLFEQGKGSKEHVILSSLGGRKASRNICCENCNIKYGNEVDTSMIEPFQHFSTMLGIKTGRNKEAPKIKNAGKIGERNFNVLPRGEIEYSSPERCVEKTKKGLNISLSGRNKKELISLLKPIYISNNIDPSKIDEIHTKSVLTKAPEIKVNITFGENEQYRSVTKMLLTYLATMISSERLRSGAFKESIRYVKGSQDIYPAWFETTQKDELPTISDINHKILIIASESQKTVYGYLELFGHISYSAILSDSWGGTSIKKCYIIDPITQKTGEYDIEHNIEIPTGFADRRSMVGKTDLLMSQYKKLIQLFEERQYKAIQDKTLEIVTEKYNLSDSENISDSVFKQAINEYTERLNCIYFGTTFEEDITIKNPFNRKT